MLVPNPGPAAGAPHLEVGPTCVGWPGWGAVIYWVMGSLEEIGPSLLQGWTWLMSLTYHIALQVSSPLPPLSSLLPMARLPRAPLACAEGHCHSMLPHMWILMGWWSLQLDQQCSWE